MGRQGPGVAAVGSTQERDPRRHPAGPLPGRAGPDHRGYRVAHHRRRTARLQCPVHLGRHHLPADEHHHRRLLRQAVGPLRSPSDAAHRYLHLPHRLGLVRPEPVDGAAHPLPWHPGRRRRRALPHLPGGHRRPLHAGRARQVPGPVRGSVRRQRGHRAAAGRLPHRPLLVALDLLREHPHRRAGDVHHLPLSAAHRARRQQARP